MRLLSFIAVMLIMASAPAFGQRERGLDGEWDVVASSSHGTAAARLVLSIDGETISGTSGPLDANRYWPLDVSGTKGADATTLAFTSGGEPVGGLRVSVDGDRLEGTGTLYGTAVHLSGTRPRGTPGPGRTHRFRPLEYQLHFSSRIPAVLTIAPGDTIVTSTVDNEGKDSGGVWRAMPGNALTGPFYVEGAMPGDTLVVRLIRIEPNRATAHMYGGQLNSRAIPSGYAQTRDPAANREWLLDLERGLARPENPGERLRGFTVPLRPMIGSIGVAPPQNQALSAGDIGFHGGNLDYNRLTAGTTLYLPVFQAGALLSLGDGHAAQGDGEISGQGLETSMDVTFAVDLIKGHALPQPWAEDERSVMISGIENSLDEALRMATASAALWLKHRYGMTDSEIATFLGAAVSYDVASIVSGRPHVVARIEKSALEMLGPTLDHAR